MLIHTADYAKHATTSCVKCMCRYWCGSAVGMQHNLPLHTSTEQLTCISNSWRKRPQEIKLMK